MNALMGPERRQSCCICTQLPEAILRFLDITDASTELCFHLPLNTEHDILNDIVEEQDISRVSWSRTSGRHASTQSLVTRSEGVPGTAFVPAAEITSQGSRLGEVARASLPQGRGENLAGTAFVPAEKNTEQVSGHSEVLNGTIAGPSSSPRGRATMWRYWWRFHSRRYDKDTRQRSWAFKA